MQRRTGFFFFGTFHSYVEKWFSTAAAWEVGRGNAAPAEIPSSKQRLKLQVPWAFFVSRTFYQLIPCSQLFVLANLPPELHLQGQCNTVLFAIVLPQWLTCPSLPPSHIFIGSFKNAKVTVFQKWHFLRPWELCEDKSFPRWTALSTSQVRG